MYIAILASWGPVLCTRNAFDDAFSLIHLVPCYWEVADAALGGCIFVNSKAIDCLWEGAGLHFFQRIPGFVYEKLLFHFPTDLVGRFFKRRLLPSTFFVER